jgi:hypothetical protein
MPGMRKTRLVYLLLWGVCCSIYAVGATPAGEAAAGEWTFVRRVDAVELYRRPVKGSDMPALQARTRFRAPVDDVFRVISDYDHFAGFIPLVSENRVVERGGGKPGSTNDWVSPCCSPTGTTSSR